MSGRDPRLERDFLDTAAHQAGLGSLGFQAEVLGRLDQTAGHAFLGYALERFAKEIAEEGRDTAGWSVGAAQCDEFNALDDEGRQEAMRWLLYLASLGARVEYGAQRLRQCMDGGS